jgi:adenylate cyclase
MKLAKTPGLLVISRTSTMRYKDSTKDIREIGRELGVTAILEGGVRKSGQQCKITAQLIDVKNGFHIWAEG